MNNLEVIYFPNEILRKVSVDIDINNKKLLNNIIDDLYKIYSLHPLVGLAAPQIGYNYNLMLAHINMNNKLPELFINPKIISYSDICSSMEEGCLSIPNMRYVVNRPIEILVEYLDINLNKQIKTFQDFNARIIQHEYDHLIGKLILDYDS